MSAYQALYRKYRPQTFDDVVRADGGDADPENPDHDRES